MKIPAVSGFVNLHRYLLFKKWRIEETVVTLPSATCFIKLAYISDKAKSIFVTSISASPPFHLSRFIFLACHYLFVALH